MRQLKPSWFDSSSNPFFPVPLFRRFQRASGGQRIRSQCDDFRIIIVRKKVFSRKFSFVGATRPVSRVLS